MELILSKELVGIFESANIQSQLHSQEKINVATIVLTIIDYYKDCPDTAVECKILKNVVTLVDKDHMKALRKGLIDLLDIPDPELKEPLSEGDKFANFSDLMSRVLKRAVLETQLDISYKNLSNSGKNELTVMELLISILSDPDCDNIKSLLTKNGISKDNLIISYMAAKTCADKFMKSQEPKNDEDKDIADLLIDSLFGGGLFDDENNSGLQEKRIEDKDSGIINKDKEEEDFEKAGYDGDAISTREVDKDSKTPTLDEFSTNMIKEAESGKYDPVVGREKELSQVFEILSCRKKNNVMLLGDPGCGKTAIVELLAQRILENNVPRDLQGKKVYSLSTTDLTSGTIYRGQLEQRIQSLCKELRENRDIILYIDEFQTATDHGSSNIAQMLKPALGRGEITLIASTTVDEYRRFIESDGALKRRFSPVMIEEPGIEETKTILQEISGKYGSFHHVRYAPSVIDKCAEWSGKYINDRFFPDKAISILDMASSLTKIEKSNYTKIDNLNSEIEKIKKEKQEKLEALDYDELGKLMKKEKSLEKKIEKLKNTESNWPEVTINEVSKSISKISNVPIDKIMSSDSKKLKEFKDILGKKVIGQDQAVSELTMALQRNILGLRNPNKPIASFLLVGGTGLGKTMISKILASEFMGTEKNLITIACSEYMQDWAESKLLGSAPGYVGFSDSEPRLYELKRKPYSVLLIDEVEKSSSNLYNIWLNMLEEGEITLSSGEKVSCRNAIIIFTGNVGTKTLEMFSNKIGFTEQTKEEKKDHDESLVMKEVKKEFRPEFINRLSKIVVFNSLSKEDLKKIFYLELDKLKDRLKENNLELKVSDQVRDFIVDKCEPEYGARSLIRLITKYIEDNICKEILNRDDDTKNKIKISLSKEKDITVKFE